MRKRKAIYVVLIVLLLGVFGYSAYKLGDYYLEKYSSDQCANQVAQHIRVTERPKIDNPDAQGSGESDVTTEEVPDRISVDFSELWQINKDIIGVLYCPDTPIKYAVVQGKDNDYYLYHLLDGRRNNNGTLFMDYRGHGDFSGVNNIIYGHHMKTGAMFGTLVKYRNQAYYNEHPVMFLATPNGQYRVELFAGCTVEALDGIYNLNPAESHIQELMRRSSFVPNEGIATEGPILTLSTCAYDFENARYVVLGRLVPMD